MTDLGFFHFLEHADGLARAVLAALVLMSIASWSLILLKLVRLWTGARQRRRFLGLYLSSPTPVSLERRIATENGDPWHELAAAGFAALQRWTHRSGDAPSEGSCLDDVLDRMLHRAVVAQRARDEAGLAVLAAVASTSPFVGLFGTVWGIYHALIAIGLSGQAGLDKVAGPVGEALTMTAVGLAVAIPAALAYNGFVRATRVATARWEDFAQEFHTFLITGLHEACPASGRVTVAPRLNVEAA
jgi:biopolymer transport protein ExbB